MKLIDANTLLSPFMQFLYYIILLSEFLYVDLASPSPLSSPSISFISFPLALPTEIRKI